MVRRGVSLTEIMIVIGLSSLILTVASVMMSRSNRQFKKGNDMISIQRLMDSIVERLRSDIRSLKRVNSCSEDEFAFVIIKNGEEAEITYKYDSGEKTLHRTEKSDGEGDIQYDFHGSKQVLSLSFDTVFDDELDGSGDTSDDNADKREFNHLNLVMQLASNEYSKKEKDASTLSIACQFYSTCVESELRIFKLSK